MEAGLCTTNLIARVVHKPASTEMNSVGSVVRDFFERACSLKGRCNFGQHKIEGTLIGIGLWAVAGCGIAFGWLGLWGYAVWIPLIVLGLLFVCLVGHFLLFLLPIELLRHIFRKSTDSEE